MKINERVMLIGSGQHGFRMSNDWDCNVYLLDAGGEYIMIDAGGGIEPERIVQRMEKYEIALDQVKTLLLTHVHADHAGGAHYFQEKYGMQIIASEEAAPWLEAADGDRTSVAPAIAAGIYPADYSFIACPVHRRVREGDVIMAGDISLQVLETPGHSRGHVSYLWEEDGKKFLFSGDTVFAGGKVVIQNVWDCIIPEYAETVHKLHLLSIDGLFPGHGVFLLEGADRHIAMAHESFATLNIPPNL